MKKLVSYFMLAALAAFTCSSCEDETGNSNGGDGSGYDFSSINSNYVEEMVLPVYSDLKEKSQTLLDIVTEVQEDPSAENISKACDAWRAARIPWEESEAFLYGPAEKKGLDPSLDSWPLNKTDILGILKGATDISVAIGKNDVHGFHTIEYLLFSEGKAKTVLKMEAADDPSGAISSERIAEYLLAATTILRNDCFSLWALWIGEEKMSEEELELAEEVEIVPGRGYAYEFKKAGSAGSSYLSSAEAFDDIISGCVTIAGEVGAQKINAPYSAKEVLDVESWYSYNSLEDFKNNILSIKGAYFGGRGKTVSNSNPYSVHSFVKEKDSQLNDKIVAAIDDTYNAINNITSPFRDRVEKQDEQAKVNSAVDACKSLETLLGKIKTLSKE